MAAFVRHDPQASTRTITAVAWVFASGGVAFFVGGALHPKEDPPDVSVKEVLRVLFKDGNWYPGHSLLLAGMVLIAAALIALVRSGALAESRATQAAGVIAAVTATVGAGAAFLHLIMASEVDRIAAGQSTPLTDTNLVVETIVTPAFGLSVAALAVLGARTGSFGNRTAAVLAVLGGIPYALAGGTILLTDALNPLFPFAGLLGVWAIVTAASLLRHRRVATPSPVPTGG